MVGEDEEAKEEKDKTSLNYWTGSLGYSNEI